MQKQCIEGYTFGFNGQIKDDEVYGEGNSYAAEFWQYDPRIGRRWNLDPEPQINISDYACFYNNPINIVDIKGNKGDDWVKGADGNIKWDNDANSQATTKSGETYLGKTLNFEFNSYIDGNLWDGPMGNAPAGDKLTSRVSLTANENEAGELTGFNVKKSVEIGKTPVGTANEYFPGLGIDQNKFSYSGTRDGKGVLTSATLNLEQHASVSPIEAMGMGIMGYDIVNVAQKLELGLSGNQLSVKAATDVFPSATLTLNGVVIMYYPQPSFKGTHGYKTNTVIGDNGTGGSTMTTLTPLRPAPLFHTRLNK